MVRVCGSGFGVCSQVRSMGSPTSAYTGTIGGGEVVGERMNYNVVQRLLAHNLNP